MPIFLCSPGDTTIYARAHNDCFSAAPPPAPLAFWASRKSLFLSCYLRRLITAHTSYQHSHKLNLLNISKNSDDLLQISPCFTARSLNVTLYQPFTQSGLKNEKKRAKANGPTGRELAAYYGKMGQESQPVKKVPLSRQQNQRSIPLSKP